jgi:hypothetical protein
VKKVTEPRAPTRNFDTGELTHAPALLDEDKMAAAATLSTGLSRDFESSRADILSFLQAHLWQEASAAAASYIREVRERAFPTPEYSYGTKRV